MSTFDLSVLIGLSIFEGKKVNPDFLRNAKIIFISPPKRKKLPLGKLRIIRARCNNNMETELVVSFEDFE